MKARVSGWAKRNPTKRKANYKKYSLRHHYGMTLAEWDALFSKQRGACSICRRPRPLCVDHCHSSGKIRGLLCRKCNSALGMLDDSIELVRRAVKYLRSV